MISIEQVFVIKFPCDSETIKLRRDRRFLMDIVTDEPNAYILTGRNVISGNWTAGDVSGKEFDGTDKVLTLTFTQTQLSEKDNCELMIADYFDPSTLGEQTVTQGSCSISYKGQPEVKVGGSYKTFTAQFFDSNGNEIFDTPVWTLTTIKPEYDDKFKTVADGNKIKIKADNVLDMIGDQILLTASTSDGSISGQIYVKVVSLYG